MRFSLKSWRVLLLVCLLLLLFAFLIPVSFASTVGSKGIQSNPTIFTSKATFKTH